MLIRYPSEGSVTTARVGIPSVLVVISHFKPESERPSPWFELVQTSVVTEPKALVCQTRAFDSLLYVASPLLEVSAASAQWLVVVN